MSKNQNPQTRAEMLLEFRDVYAKVAAEVLMCPLEEIRVDVHDASPELAGVFVQVFRSGQEIPYELSKLIDDTIRQQISEEPSN